jgi:hypothetical protein
MSEKLLRWFIFSVVISLLPLAFYYVRAMTDGKAVSLPELLARGELLLIAVALAADAIGDLLASKSAGMLKTIAGGGCVITVGFSSFYFADVSTKTAANVTVVFWMSLVLFAVSMISSACCKWLAEEAK